ncbi:unnamed protein product [Echinostoma caproni]|uniref:EGF-like domain-containing protein n=1 Tax=Echinostoma caproni TaxID=27848 RepID=A0A183ASD7_9TREM|nr:unnamed protein product [Echinostoma caproni]
MNNTITRNLFELKHCASPTHAFHVIYNTANTKLLKFAEANTLTPDLRKQRVDAYWTLLPGEGDFLKWAKRDGGYACDCAPQHRWVDTSLQCERTADWVDQCKSSSSGSVHNLGPCNKNGTFQCTTDQNTGAAYCDCNPGFIGVRCEQLLDACLMSLVTYVYKDPKTGKKDRFVICFTLFH